MVSRELLMELGYEVHTLEIASEDIIMIYPTYNHKFRIILNKYKLANDLKDWSYDNGFIIKAFRQFNEDTTYFARVYVKGKEINFFTAGTEPNAVFKACEWVLEELKIVEVLERMNINGRIY